MDAPPPPTPQRTLSERALFEQGKHLKQEHALLKATLQGRGGEGNANYASVVKDAEGGGGAGAEINLNNAAHATHVPHPSVSGLFFFFLVLSL